MPKELIRLKMLDELTVHKYDQHYTDWHSCTRCAIGDKAFHHVFIRGTIPCNVLLIGEGPGLTEDLTGYPFTGAAGKLLDKWLAPYTTLRFAITNTVACRPTHKLDGKVRNRPPTPLEQNNCRPRLGEAIHMADPEAVIFLGQIAAEGEIIFPPKCKRRLGLYHPAYILRSGGDGSPLDRIERAKLGNFLEEIL